MSGPLGCEPPCELQEPNLLTVEPSPQLLVKPCYCFMLVITQALQPCDCFMPGITQALALVKTLPVT